MDPGTGVVEVHHVGTKLIADHVAQIHMEHPPVVGQRHMDVGAAAEKSPHQRRGNICQTASFGTEAVRHVSHAGGQRGDLRRHHQDPG